MSDFPNARTVMGALRGNQAARAQLVQWALPRLSGTVDRYRREIAYRRKNEWEVEDARERAMNGDVPAEQTIGALSDLQQRLIRLLALTPAAMMADEQNVERINEEWQNAALGLMLALHNPTIKYGIIGGLDPELREDAEEYVERMSRELWGTVQALASEDEVDVEGFPPETRDIIQHVAEQQAPEAEQGD